MKKSMLKDRILGIACLIFSAFFTYYTLQIKMQQRAGDPGPRLFPLIGCVLMAVCALILIIKPPSEKNSEDNSLHFTREEWKRCGILFFTYAAFIVCLWFFGFAVTLPAFSLAIAYMFAPDKQKRGKTLLKALLFALCLCVAVYLVYVKLFGTVFPKGFLWESLLK